VQRVAVCVCVCVCMYLARASFEPTRPNHRETHMTVSSENATPPKSTESRNSNFSVQIQIQPTSRFEFVPRDTGESEFLDLVDCGDVAFSVESVVLIHICIYTYIYIHIYICTYMIGKRPVGR